MIHTHTRRVHPRVTIPRMTAAIPEPSRITFGIVWLLCLTLAILYGYLVNQTVVNIVARTDTEATIEDVRSAISDLEAEYLATKNAITLEYAYSLGFQDLGDPKYVSRVDSDTLLSYEFESVTN